MSARRSLSFTEDENDLLSYFDDNGKSDIAKIALKFYIENKDKKDGLNDIDKLSDSIVNKLTVLISKVGINKIESVAPVENRSVKKGFKLVK